jgi:hypothetical protein
MEVHHKPKAWHSFRDFLKEYLIVVVGVLTALAAEQGVEWLHWRHQVEDSEQRIASEVRFNLGNANAQLVAQRCYDERLVNLRDQLLGAGLWRGAAIRRTPVQGSESIPPFMRAGIFTSASPPVYVAASAIWTDSTWTSSLASGVVLHMRPDRADAYARLYRGFAAMQEIQRAEADAAAKLSVLAFDRKLSDARTSANSAS